MGWVGGQPLPANALTGSYCIRLLLPSGSDYLLLYPERYTLQY
jgi:hypothetical protein